MKCYYAGIGSRQTPPEIMQLMTKAAQWLSQRGLILRSGGADGADKAFEAGAGDLKEIFLPWRMFNRNPSKLYPPSLEAAELAAQHHPAWENCYAPARKLLARNAHQIMGKDLNDPVLFVVCYTWNGEDVGGTGTALRIARANQIPVHNLHDAKTRDFIERLVS